VLLSDAALFGILKTLIGLGTMSGTHLLHRVARKIPHTTIVIRGARQNGLAVLVTAVFGKVITTAAGMLELGFFAAFIIIPRADSAPAGDAARHAGPIAGAGDVRGGPGGRAGGHPEPVLRENGDAGRNRAARIQRLRNRTEASAAVGA
jgi:hypothetical protein